MGTRAGTPRPWPPNPRPCLITSSLLKPLPSMAENPADSQPILVPVGRWRPVIDFSSLPRRTRREWWTLHARSSLGARRIAIWIRRLACTLTASVALAGLSAHAAPAPTDLNQAKANMLWNIAKFVEWPTLPEDRNSPLVFTILGEDDLAASLAGLLSSRTVNGRPVFVRFARRPQDAKGSQILYLAASESEQLAHVLAAVDSTAVLTVSDAPGFAARGGMVGFETEGTRVRFEVNRNQAERNGLKLSAKLLSLAKLVDSDSPGNP